MPREYQRKKENPYLLPDNLYKTVKYTIKDYDRLREEYEEIMNASPPQFDSMPRGSKTGNPTEDKALKCEVVSCKLKAIEQALMMVPPEYRNGVFSEAKYGGGFPIDASERTYKTWKQRFIYWTAKKMNFI